MKNFLTKFILITLLSFSANALGVEERIPDKKLEQRAQELFKEIRCIVCEGQVIESSNAEFSYEMRKLIRKRILLGKSNQLIKNELVREFGDDILLNPDLKKQYLLWLLPLIFGIFGGLFLFLTYRKITVQPLP